MQKPSSPRKPRSPSPVPASAIETRELVPARWDDVERLFGSKGACGGCWCMYWRLDKGEKWESVKGETARERFQAGVKAGTIHGVLAYADGEPVGWCTFGPRPSFSRLDRAPSFACDDAATVWSIPCFFVKSGCRGQGVASALLTAALEILRRSGARVVEGYPAKPGKDGKYVAAFAWTGTRSLFGKLGFTPVGSEEGGKVRVRLAL